VRPRHLGLDGRGPLGDPGARRHGSRRRPLPYSIPTFITNDGLAPAGFTTVAGVNPATETRWRNQTDTLLLGGRATNDALYVAFDQMWRKLRWKRIKGFNSQVGSPGTDFDKFVIVTTPEGVNGYLAEPQQQRPAAEGERRRLRRRPDLQRASTWRTSSASKRPPPPGSRRSTG
jgi:hypothetical protein